MDRAGLYENYASSSSTTSAICGLTALIGVALLPFLGLKVLVVACGLATFGYAALALPVQDSVLAYFGYLMLDGAVKVLSGYNPVVHVAQDIFLLTIAARVLANPETGFGAWRATPFFPLFALFATAVFVQYLNPFGLGFWPSVAGTKVYLAGAVLFFVVFQTYRSIHVRRLCVWIVALGCIETSLACIEYVWFPEKIFALHPKYAALAGDRFVGAFYRPFGTTSAPGAPSLWTYLCAPFALNLLLASRSWKERTLSVLFLALCVPTLVFCQTRAAMVLFGVVCLLAFFAPNGNTLRRTFLLGLGVLMIALAVPAFLGQAEVPAILLKGQAPETEKASALGAERAEAVNKRLLTLLEGTTYGNARSGAWERITELAGIMPWGIGLSRVGAASAVWKNQIEQDKYFGKDWSFADNVYRAIFTELGLFGLVSWILLCGTLAIYSLASAFRAALPRRRTLLWICGVVPMVTLLAGFGSEGVLYMPVGAFFWTCLALGLREASYV